MTLTEKVWRQQYTDLCKALRTAGAIQTDADGFQWVDESRAPKMAETYRQMASVGYWNGWL